MDGCAAGGANATFANRACAAGAHVCTSNEWVQNRAGIAPLHHYWTDDALNYGAGSGPCGTLSCGTGNCFVTTGTTYAINCGATTPMRVCAGTGGSPVTDPEGNTCNWTACGFNSVSPNAYFGGCSGNNTAGVLCCSGTHQYFVNASTGNDSNPGTSASPFKTITRALSFAVGRDTVFVKPGTYSAGETFPLQVPAGVNLIGDEPNRGGGVTPTTMNGHGLANGSTFIGAVVVPAAGATVAGFTVTTTAPPSGQFGMGIYPSASGAIIRNNTITGNQSNGIYINVSGSTNHLMLLNSITANSSNGIANRTIQGGKAENNTITGNAYGVDFDGPGADFGGGPANSVGNNILSCNSNSDIWTNTAISIFASNNKWDHVPPTSSTTSATGGIDIYNGGGATITTTGSSQAPIPCPACSITAVSQQAFDSTMTGCGGVVSFANRSTLCPSGCHVCGANEWLAHHGTLAPAHNYWTNDLLGYNSPSPPVCFSTSGPNFCSAANQGPGGVCVTTQPDPEGNNCNNPGHALCPDTTSNQFFGGCNGLISGVAVDRSGALCCCP
jgi:hypothetical protein